MAWRLARSLKKLQSELNSKYPNRTVPDWSIGDPAHAARPSDHNPNAAGVVCAIDIRQGGINLGAVANAIKAKNNTPVKYVIYNRRIWSKKHNSSGWRDYFGSNPHTTHIHVSVGVGSDGQSTGPYDSQASWGISNVASNPEMGDDMIGLRKGDSGEEVKGLQATLQYAGFDLPIYGVDGDYGVETAKALLACRRSVGSEGLSHYGDSVTGYAFGQLMMALAKNH